MSSSSFSYAASINFSPKSLAASALASFSFSFLSSLEFPLPSFESDFPPSPSYESFSVDD